MLKSYFKQLLKQYKIQVIISVCISIVLYPALYIALTPRTYSDLYTTIESFIHNMNLSVFYIYLIVVVLFSGLLTYMYYRNDAIDLMNSLPMNKKRRKTTELMFGWSILFVPMIIGFLIVSLYYLSISKEAWTCYGLNSIAIVSSLNLLYFLCMLTYSLCSSTKEAFINMSVVLAILFLLPTSIGYLISNTTINAHYFDFSMQDSMSIFNYLITLIRSIVHYNFIWSAPEHFNVMITNFSLLSIVQWVLSFLIGFSIVKLAGYKKAEDASGNRKNYILYYTCVGIAGFVGLCLYSTPYIDKFAIYIGIVLLFMILTLFFEVSLKNVGKTILVLLISFVCFLSLKQIIIQTEFFGTYRSFKDIENITMIEVDLGSENLIEDETGNDQYIRTYIKVDSKADLKKATQIFSNFQDQLVDEFKKNIDNPYQYDPNDKYVGFYYKTKDSQTTKDYMYTIDTLTYLDFIKLCEENDIEIKKDIQIYNKETEVQPIY